MPQFPSLTISSWIRNVLTDKIMKCLMVIILCFFVETCSVVNSHFLKDVNDSSDETCGFKKLLQDVFSWHFKDCYHINVFFLLPCSESDSCSHLGMPRYIHNQFKLPVKISENLNFRETEIDKNSSHLLRRYRKKRSQFGESYLVVAQNAMEIIQFVNNTNPPWRPDVKLLLVSLERRDNLIYEYLFENLWVEYNIVHGILMAYDCSLKEAWVYNPFIRKYGTKFGKMFSLFKNGEIDQSAMIDIRNFDMNGYVFRASVMYFRFMMNDTVKYLDDFILEILASRMNFTINASEPSSMDSIEFQNGTITGALKDIGFYNKDIIMTSKVMKAYKTIDMEYVLPVLRYGKCCLLVPKAAKMPSWISLIKCCSKEVWLCFLLTFFVCTAFLHILKIFSLKPERKSKDLKLSQSFTIVMNVIFATPFSRIFSVKGMPERIMLSSFMFFSIVISSVFVGVLFKFLKNPGSYKEINTLDDVLKSGLPIFAYTLEIYEFFKTLDTEVANRLFEKLYVDETDTSLDNIIDYKNATILITYISASSIAETFFYFDEYMHIGSECPIIYLASYGIPKGSIYLVSIHRIVSRLYEAGLTDWWSTSVWERMYLPYRFEFAQYRRSELKPFTLKDFYAAFLVLLIGLSAAVVAAILEHVLYRLKRRVPK